MTPQTSSIRHQDSAPDHGLCGSIHGAPAPKKEEAASKQLDAAVEGIEALVRAGGKKDPLSLKSL